MQVDRMSHEDMRDIYVFNCQRREALLNEAMKLDEPEARMQFVVDYFLNRLDASVIAKIDGTSVDEVVPFKYDYSFLEDLNSEQVRKREVRQWGNSRDGFNLTSGDVDNRKKEQVKIFPAVYALKMGTCIMFASELQRFAYDFGIDGKIVKKIDYCYDKFDGTSTEYQEMHTDRLIKMEHFYNVFTVDGREFKVDIAGLLTAQDFNKNHPEFAIDVEQFYFGEDTEKGPFSKIATNEKVLNFGTDSQNQPQ